MLAPALGRLPRHRRAGPRRGPHRRRPTARGDPGAGRRPPRPTAPGGCAPTRPSASSPWPGRCCARTPPGRGWSPGERPAGSADRPARRGRCAPTPPALVAEIAAGGTNPRRCSPRRRPGRRSCAGHGHRRDATVLQLQGARVGVRRGDLDDAPARLRGVRVDASAPVTTRLLWREVRAELAQARGDAPRRPAARARRPRRPARMAVLVRQPRPAEHPRRARPRPRPPWPRARRRARRPGPGLRVVRTRPGAGRPGRSRCGPRPTSRCPRDLTELRLLQRRAAGAARTAEAGAVESFAGGSASAGGTARAPARSASRPASTTCAPRSLRTMPPWSPTCRRATGSTALVVHRRAVDRGRPR